jgi:hypothetical protein
MIANQRSLLSEVHTQLNTIGYNDELLRKDYIFDDAYSSDKNLCIPLAAFAQFPPSYRNACIGILTANGNSGSGFVSDFRALGAPMFFEVLGDHIRRYRVNPSGAEFLESIDAKHIKRAFEINRDQWSPLTIFRAKSTFPSIKPFQLDFVDIGLLPALKGMIDSKLDRLLKKILHEATSTFRRNNLGAVPDLKRLFRLVFRYLAAKIFNDRGHSGNWGNADASIIIEEINEFYRLPDGDRDVLDDPNTQQAVWDRFRNAFNFQNLSVDDLAFIYENTLIEKSTRKQLGTHSTPPEIANLLVDHLPFEDIPLDNRYVLEPCAGHGVFLVASLRRLRDLLPSSWSSPQRHEYLKDRLTAIEIDFFAAEVCRLCLMLADYPNPNGWKIFEDDIFGSNILEQQLEASQIILCNPPFEDFTKSDREKYGERIKSSHKPFEVLRRILNHPPKMLGYVLPKSAIMGKRYQELQTQIARNYKKIETIALPDTIFKYSQHEPILLIATDYNPEKNADVSISTFWVRAENKFELVKTGQLPYGIKNIINRSKSGNISLWKYPFSEIWEYLDKNPKLSEIAEIHRGIEWNLPLDENRDLLISLTSTHGYKKGLDTASGKIEPFYIKDLVYLNMNEKYKKGSAHFLPWSKPKVIVNAYRISRGAWRLVGYPDQKGLVHYQTLIGVWPTINLNVDVLAAIINSPLTNARTYMMEHGRANRIDTLKNIPIPFLNKLEQDNISHLVRKYVEVRSQVIKSLDNGRKDEIVKILLQIDSLVMKAYDLPPKYERNLLDFFNTSKRPGPFNFPEYYPHDFSPYIPLHLFLQMDLKKASAGELLKRIRPIDSSEAHDFAIDLEKGYS